MCSLLSSIETLEPIVQKKIQWEYLPISLGILSPIIFTNLFINMVCLLIYLGLFKDLNEVFYILSVKLLDFFFFYLSLRYYT